MFTTHLLPPLLSYLLSNTDTNHLPVTTLGHPPYLVPPRHPRLPRFQSTVTTVSRTYFPFWRTQRTTSLYPSGWVKDVTLQITWDISRRYTWSGNHYQRTSNYMRSWACRDVFSGLLEGVSDELRLENRLQKRSKLLDYFSTSTGCRVSDYECQATRVVRSSGGMSRKHTWPTPFFFFCRKGDSVPRTEPYVLYLTFSVEWWRESNFGECTMYVCMYERYNPSLTL